MNSVIFEVGDRVLNKYNGIRGMVIRTDDRWCLVMYDNSHLETWERSSHSELQITRTLLTSLKKVEEND